jgi:ElaB/YqjD/DUF883 family membrane-anchored ribosome-binding protein
MTDTTSPAPAQQGTVQPTETSVEQVASEVHPQPDPAEAPAGERPSRARERIEELAAERRAALEYGEFWRKRFEESQQTQQSQLPAQPQEEPRPKRADFEDDDAWADALTTWTDKRATQKAEQAAVARFAKEQEQSRLRTQQSTFATRAESFVEKHPDFQVAISNPAMTFMNGEFLGVIMESEKGPELAYHIAKSPELVAKLARQTNSQRLATLGRIEAELSRPLPPPKVSSAPPPPSPIGSGPSTVNDLSKMSDSEWWSARKQNRK